mgnify:CR=1 FL=1
MYMILLESLLFLSVGWPLLILYMLIVKKMHSTALYLAPWAAIPALMAAVFITPDTIEWNLPWLLLGSKVGLDQTGKVFLLLAGLLWTVAGIYAKTYFPDIGKQVRFYRFFLLAMVGNFSLILAQDLISFYLGFTLMSFASYVLVVFKGDKVAFKAGTVYIALVVVGEVILFAALLMATKVADATTFEAVRQSLINAQDKDMIILLVLAGFGVKAGVIGFHVWLPLAHPVAPTPASAVLSGTMIKAGLLGWLRMLPLGEIALPDWGVVVVILGLATAFYGVAIGLTQRNPKTLLAYSSISQMGIITISIGLGMFAPQAWPIILPGIAFYALHHGLSKGALFLGVGLSGSNHHLQRHWIWFGLWLPALALAGAPLTSGMMAKYLIKSYAFYAPTPWDWLLPILLSASAVATALLMARLLYLLRPAAIPFGSVPVAGLVWPWIVLLLAIIVVPLLSPSLEHIGKMELVGSLWPLLLSFFIFVAVLKTDIFRFLQPVPAGDVLVLLQHTLQLLQSMIKHFSKVQLYFMKMKRFSKLGIAIVWKDIITITKKNESFFTNWETSVSFVVVLMLVTSILAMIS